MLIILDLYYSHNKTKMYVTMQLSILYHGTVENFYSRDTLVVNKKYGLYERLKGKREQNSFKLNLNLLIVITTKEVQS